MKGNCEDKTLKSAPHHGGAAQRAEGTFFPQMADPGLYGLLKTFAKENRAHQTEGESAMWNILGGLNLGVRFRRQHVIKNYIADFICLEKKLIIEVDGAYHFTTEQIGHDMYRTKELEKYGFKVLRFTNEEVIGDMSKVRNTIIDEIEKINEITI